jgi:hypothetical protein
MIFGYKTFISAALYFIFEKMNIAPPPKNLYLQYGRLFGVKKILPL